MSTGFVSRTRELYRSSSHEKGPIPEEDRARRLKRRVQEKI